jgi:hypothetical protein
LLRDEILRNGLGIKHRADRLSSEMAIGFLKIHITIYEQHSDSRVPIASRILLDGPEDLTDSGCVSSFDSSHRLRNKRSFSTIWKN